MSWAILAPFIALAITFVAMEAAVVLAGWIRRCAYHRFENKSQESVAQQFPLPTIDQSPAEQRRKALSPFVDPVHAAANAAQTRYHNAVARSAGCLVAAFIAMVLGTLPQQDWPLPSWPHTDHHSIEYVLTWIDAIAIVFVFLLFHYARNASRCWLATRVGVELLRQYQFLNVIIPNTSVGPQVDKIKSQFALEADSIKTRVQDGSINEMISRVERFWSERKASIEERTLAISDITADALLVYLQRRARRQLGWFTDSKARLEHVAEWRNIVLLSLYSISAVLAVVKLFLFVLSGNSPAYLLRILLIITGISAAMTAYYINQNTRSLIHRYNTQQRQIVEWLEAFNKRWHFADLRSLTIHTAEKTEIGTRILQFEELMIEELVDWLHITSHDAIELAP